MAGIALGAGMRFSVHVALACLTLVAVGGAAQSALVNIGGKQVIIPGDAALPV